MSEDRKTLEVISALLQIYIDSDYSPSLMGKTLSEIIYILQLSDNPQIRLHVP